MKKRKNMKPIEHKSNAVRIAYENKGECIQAILLIFIPKLIFVAECILLVTLYALNVMGTIWLALGVTAALILLLILNALVSSIGELMLADISYNDYIDNEESCNSTAFSRSFELIKEIKVMNLIKIRLSIIQSLLLSSFITLLPAVILSVAFIAAILYGDLPVLAFVTVVIGLILIIISSILHSFKEYDKYSFVYAVLRFSPRMLPSDVVNVSVTMASSCIGEIRRCKASYIGYTILSIILTPIIVPMMYTILHKKLSVYDIYNVMAKQNTVGNISQDPSNFDTVIFEIFPVFTE